MTVVDDDFRFRDPRILVFLFLGPRLIFLLAFSVPLILITHYASHNNFIMDFSTAVFRS